MSKRVSLRRAAISYLLLVGLPLAALALVLGRGSAGLGGVASAPRAPAPGFGLPNLGLLIIQIIVILAVARAVGLLFRVFKQPQVVGEMAAGILLGPSVFGAAAPDVFAAVFPAPSLGYLYTLSQLGLLLFMFVIGLEFDAKLMRGRGQAAVITSHASIVLPFLLGALVALHLYPTLAPEGVRFTGFALFMGAAMSITAFPVLARILVERQLTNTRIGVIALACAAIDDVTAWCILAAVVIAVRATAGHGLLWTIGGSLLFTSAMVFVVRPLIKMITRRLHDDVRLTHDVIAGLLIFAFGCAFITEYIGIHALFGAFLAGAVVPRDEAVVQEMLHRLEDFTVVFLLPLFFAFTGLRMSFTSIASEFWLAGLLVLVCAIAGKLGGSAVAARASGLSWREAFALGTLLNTRGLMELVILNVGLDIGVISRPLFSIMVVMALITTAMTAPVLDLLGARRLFSPP
jgi:Kef-type K+ transport system membrane component KefB